MKPDDFEHKEREHTGDHRSHPEQHGHGHAHEVMIKVDGQSKHVKAGTYTVAAFKQLVGVAADRELDIFHNGSFEPLDDNGKITIHGHEVFVSHVRTGGSS